MSIASETRDLEIWGGVECTCNRVQGEYMDQLALSGHDGRESDLELFAELGIKAIRYPILWERTVPRGVALADWTWADGRLCRLKQLDLPPIVGLVHHGSGPRSTQLDDASFAPGLAEYAGAVARRYPWVEWYTPVNEPLTTARFSGLYGHWYPHGCSDLTFARAVLNQCRATVLAMRKIREVNPAAKLVQTEDLGKTYSTPALAYQAEFENERRWVTFDLLTGQLTADRPMWHFFRYVGIDEDELAWFVDNPCPPDIVGCNHYVIGERLLDDRLEHYPTWMHGGNGRHRYVDVEAVRVRGEGLAGWRDLLHEAWDRYRLPLAMTEVHLNCHREAQLCWLLEAWQAAHELRAIGVDVRALTAWSLLGAFNWNTVVTRDVGHYESGVFDLGSGTPRPTALSAMLKALAREGQPNGPNLCPQGWWRRPGRLCYPPVYTEAGSSPSARAADTIVLCEEVARQANGPPLLITGGNGTLGQAFAQACCDRDLNHVVCTREELDITDASSLEGTLSAYSPWAVINTAGYARVDDAERDALRCHQANTHGAAILAQACSSAGVRLLTFSSALVFAGDRDVPYVEADEVRPLNVYGRSKAEAERRVLASYPKSLVVRTSVFFGPWDPYNFLTRTLDRLQAGLRVDVAEDWIVSPTYLPDLVHRCLDLLIDGESGLWHLANEGTTSWASFARHAARVIGMDDSGVRGCRGEELRLPACRPRFSVLGSKHGRLLPPLDDGIRRYCEARRVRSVEPRGVAVAAAQEAC